MAEITTIYGRSNVQSLLNSLIARTSKNQDPVMITVLQEITNELNRLGIEVYGEPVLIGGKGTGSGAAKPDAPTDFGYTLNSTNVVLYWTPFGNAFSYYELRKGTTWEFAERVLTTSNVQAIINPLLVGTHTYLLRSINTEGEYSEGIASVTIIIPPIGTFIITPIVVQNAITLSWTVPTSTFSIDYYEIRRNGVLIASNDGTFFAVSEQAGGDYTYSVIAVDVAGNRSAETSTSVHTTGVTDYIFYARLDAQLNGTIVNGKKYRNELYFNILNETYQQHFASRNLASPQAQVNAGYSPWLSPYALTGSYEEIFDFGTVINNVIVNITWAYQIHSGAFTFGLQSSTSINGIGWTANETASSFFTPSVRYVKVKINFTAQNDKSLVSFKDFTVGLNVKRENDGGEGTSLASDTLGTVVNFKKQFVDVEAITVTPVSTTSTFATHEFADTPYPTSFKVKIFDNAGVRITRDFRWNARGIV